MAVALTRCHRALPGDSEPPRPFILKIHYTHELKEILRKVAEMQQITFNGQRILIFPDYPLAVVNQRAMFKRATELLKNKLGVRQSYNGLEKTLKEVFSERSSILHQLSKTSKELDSIKGNIQSLKNDDSVAKKDVQRILDLSHKQREEMKSLQAALQKQLDEANERAEKQQAT
eukprot:superscaffoldBa00000102_g1489